MSKRKTEIKMGTTGRKGKIQNKTEKQQEGTIG
jgi:hypothetical protein